MNKKNTFYVGYLPLPNRQQRFLIIFVPLVLIGVVVLGFLIASGQKSPGTGKGWDPTGKSAITLRARIFTQPYGLIRFKQAGYIQTAILTSMTKSGVQGRIKNLNNQLVELTGVMTHKGSRSVFSILDNTKAIRPLSFKGGEGQLGFAPIITLGKKTLRGEIIDPKCYIGAMKPGGGKTHKACAALCLKGGIPPMFVVRDKFLQEQFYLLLTEDGKPILNTILPFVGDPVEVTGEVQQWGDLLVYKVLSKNIKRLN